MARFWHIAHPSWTPGEPLRCRYDLLDDGREIPWLWDEADEGTDCDRVCLFPDTEKGRDEAEWMLGERPGYTIVLVELPDDFPLISATWEDYPAVWGEIPAEHLSRASVIGDAPVDQG